MPLQAETEYDLRAYEDGRREAAKCMLQAVACDAFRWMSRDEVLEAVFEAAPTTRSVEAA